MEGKRGKGGFEVMELDVEPGVEPEVREWPLELPAPVPRGAANAESGTIIAPVNLYFEGVGALKLAT